MFLYSVFSNNCVCVTTVVDMFLFGQSFVHMYMDVKSYDQVMRLWISCMLFNNNF